MPLVQAIDQYRAAIKIKEAPAQGQTIFEYAEGTNAAEDYAAVVDAILASRAKAGRVEADASPAPAARWAPSGLNATSSTLLV